MTIDVTTTDILPAGEAAELEACETVIREGLAQFLAVGNALVQIRDARLYRADFDTFEGYCRTRWNISRPRAYELMGASQTIEELSAIADASAVVNEGQARELRRIIRDEGVEVAAEVLTYVKDQGAITARALQLAALTRAARADAAERLTQLRTTEPELAELVDSGADTSDMWAVHLHRDAERERAAAEAARQALESERDALVARALQAHGIDRLDETHEAPWMSEDEFHRLRYSVRKRGVREEVAVVSEEDGTTTLLDGLMRICAATLEGRLAPLRRLPHDCKRSSWTVSVNVHRYHHSPDQIAAGFAFGSATGSEPWPIEEYASTEHGRRELEMAVAVHAADPDVCQQVLSGTLDLATAYAQVGVR